LGHRRFRLSSKKRVQRGPLLGRQDSDQRLMYDAFAALARLMHRQFENPWRREKNLPTAKLADHHVD
jgi:hypothetical protein